MRRARPRSYDESIYDGLSHRVEEWGPSGPPEIVAACCHLDAAIAAYEAMIPARPGRRLVLRWGGWAIRDSARDGERRES